MLFIFNIKKQQDKLKLRYYELMNKSNGLKVTPIEGISKVIKEHKDACMMHRDNIKTTLGRLKSFLPWTMEFNCRLIAATRCEELSKYLDKLQSSINIAKPAIRPEQNKRIKKTLSEPTEVIYKSPILSNKIIKTRSFGDLATVDNLKILNRI